jgi:DNA topoisomerase-1
MKLVIVESPTKEKTIARYLGKDYRVKATRGHIRDLAKTGLDNLGIDVNNQFEPTYEIDAKKVKVIDGIKYYLDKVDEIYLATDPDREGEAIAWHIAKVLDLDVNKTPRLEFNEITKYGIEEAFKKQRVIDLNLVSSQETRRIIDRIIGFKLSTLLQRKINSKSAGRVQSAVLKLIVDRELEITNFVKEEYWNIHALINHEGQELTPKLARIDGKEFSLKDEASAQAVVAKIGDQLVVKSVETKEEPRSSLPPFNTASLYRMASSQFNYNSTKTAKIAQTLYEGVKIDKKLQGLVTYIRTDSTRLSPIFINQAKKKIEELFGPEYVGVAKVPNNNKNVQNAHEAIRPVDVNKTPDSIKDDLSTEQYNVYKLIYDRAIASIMTKKLSLVTTVLLTSGNLEFELQASVLKFDGYSKLYGVYEKKVNELSLNLTPNQNLKVIEPKATQEFTKPPYRYNEASIIETMEKLGIGRPSTYATTLSTLKQRLYVEVKRGQLTPTKQGMLTTKKLEEFFISIVDSKYTADMEENLDKIAEGNVQQPLLLKDFYHEFKEKFEIADKNMEKVEAEKVGEVCPQCGKELVYRTGRYGQFIACSGYPECKYLKKEVKEIPANAKTCPKCNEGKLILRNGRYGAFLACNRYPDCKYIEKFYTKSKKAS